MHNYCFAWPKNTTTGRTESKFGVKHVLEQKRPLEIPDLMEKLYKEDALGQSPV
jgi:hypothetical protein